VATAPEGLVASREKEDGTLESVGFVVSVTVTVKLPFDELPLASVAVQVTTVLPTG